MAGRKPKQETGISSRDSARIEFFRAIKSHAPAVLSSLESDVLPLYNALISPGPFSANIMVFDDPAILPEHLTDMARSEMVSNESLEKEYLTTLPIPLHTDARFQLALCKWGKGYYLTDEWIFSEALKTLDLWHRFGKSGEWACASQAYVPDGEMYEDEQAFHFTFDPWDAASDTRTSYEKKANDSFKAWLEDYCERMEESHGDGNKAYDSRKLDHYVWLVEHQINGLRYADISEKHQGEKGLDFRNISEAINRLAKMIGLTRRRTRGRSAKL